MCVIWACYTEVASEPYFHGYVTSKKEAKQWTKDESKYFGNFGDIKTKIFEDEIRVDNGEQFAVAIRLEKIEM